MGNLVTSATVDAPRRRMRRAERSEQLLDIAEAVLTERGITAASMADVAERAGVTKPVLYDHFGSKDGLVAAVVERAGAVLYDAVVAAVAGADDAEQALAQGLRAYFRFIEDRRSGLHRLLTEGVTPGSAAAAAVERIRDRQVELVAVLLHEDTPACPMASARLYAQIVIGASERLATRPDADPDESVDLLTQHVLDVVWRGFRTLRDETESGRVLA